MVEPPPRQAQEALVDPVRSDDAPKDDKKDKKSIDNGPTNGFAPDGRAKDAKAEELSEEDAQLKSELTMLVERLQEDDAQLHRPALESMRTLIKTSTSSMTSVPKPLKYLRPLYPDLQSLYSQWSGQSLQGTPAEPSQTLAGQAIQGISSFVSDAAAGAVNFTFGTNSQPAPSTSSAPPHKPKAAGSDVALLADLLSVLAMTYSDNGKRETLLYRLRGGSQEDPGSWGNEYVRHLAAEIGEEYEVRRRASLATLDAPTDTAAPTASGAVMESQAKDAIEPTQPPTTTDTKELEDLALKLVPFFLSHNGEADAVDLLLEIESIEQIVPFVDENTYARVCLYMVSCVNLLVPPDDRQFLRSARDIYRKQGRWTEALTLAIRLNDRDAIRADFNGPESANMKRQMAYILARQQINLETDDQDLIDILNNAKLTEHFKLFGKELSVSEPKSLEDIYKSHLENTRPGTIAAVDSAKQNLAGTFVNAFVNAGFGNDKLMAAAEEGQSWIYKNKDHGMLSAAASLGMSLLWDPDMGLSQIDKYTYSSEEYIKAGALLANGLIHSGIRTEMDAALALLSEHIESSSPTLRIMATMGIGIAYAGSQREDILELLLPAIADTSLSMEIASVTALALGFVFVGTCNGDITGTILQTMMEREDKELSDKWARFMGLGLALLNLGRQDDADATLETLKAIEVPLGKQAQVLVDMCAFAGTGNVLKIQDMLTACTPHVEEDSDSAIHQGFAVLAIALIATGEDVGAEMCLRQFSHLMHYGDAAIRRAVPLALGLISASNPSLSIMDTLSKYSHDNDQEVALNAIFAMGLIGAGTNQARLAQLLRQLASYYAKDPEALFMVRVSQGLVHMGKGTIGLAPFHTDRSLMSPAAMAGLLSTLLAFTDVKGFILDKSHWLLFLLAPAMYPRFLITFDEKGEVLPVSVRVGQAVDTVGQPGKPKSITGFQTHTTPVRLANTERAEMATEEWFPYTHVLEGFVILKKNEGYDQEDNAATASTAKMELS
ncbi:uncharacterized protein L969DRAFT_89035 [Mixia osmundae IAM 14324]|uniref:26S proteasome regulatory subunit RPN1 n=1 Tax=Mixia osmundae (strain CBS 9802 / IAM 14324 / JCM 22182 / KY 12970) TaxID=764103 RepID=G7E821_MIXOS|nr:uncharacterized protein L969DRAFT_89035 [Mixia osmundae IAM 14324]KEI38582.1 hypothetical protein L969DRAFT_89035 [Mixia osmundae IAM 14324]GAA98981.1 hypothetical protein E5Q_05670 [Mixia osmundae IAM 14324]